MRKILLLILLIPVFYFLQNSVQAQKYSRNNVLKINPLSLGLLTFNGSYERVINYNTSLQLGVYYTNASVFNTSWEGIGITPEARIYFGKSKPRVKRVPEGLYIAPFARLQILAIAADLLEKEARATLSAVSGGVIGGYQLLWGRKDQFSLDLFIGPQFDKSKVVMERGAREEYFGGLGNFSGLSLRSGLAVGLVF